jgi:hypothetical protein
MCAWTERDTYIWNNIRLPEFGLESGNSENINVLNSPKKSTTSKSVKFTIVNKGVHHEEHVKRFAKLVGDDKTVTLVVRS